MEFGISLEEIIRRKKAYIRLSISLIVGIFLGSKLFNFYVSIFIYLLVVFVLFLLGWFSFNFFKTIKSLKIYFKDKYLERIIDGKKEKYWCENIERIKTKRTFNGNIREIYITFKNKKTITITGLDNFEGFWNKLNDNLEKNIKRVYFKEFIDFDHPLFYVVLGLLIGGFGIWFFKLALEMDFGNIKMWIFGYLMILGLYFLVFNPISQRSGENKKDDLILGIFMIVSGIIIFGLLG